MLALIRNVGFKRNPSSNTWNTNKEITRSIVISNTLYTKSKDEQNAREIAESVVNDNKINRNPDGSGNEQDAKQIANDVIKSYPEAPTTCCMTGCANCVYLDYAEKLSEYYKDGGEKALKDIEEQIEDGNLKAFLMHEIRMRLKK